MFYSELSLIGDDMIIRVATAISRENSLIALNDFY